MKTANELLNQNIKAEVGNIANELKEQTTREVRNSLKSNETALQEGIKQYKDTMETINKKMQSNLYDFENSKRKFFKMDGLKNVFFWVGIGSSTGLLIERIIEFFVK